MKPVLIYIVILATFIAVIGNHDRISREKRTRVAAELAAMPKPSRSELSDMAVADLISDAIEYRRYHQSEE
jgi:hypothetical protein